MLISSHHQGHPGLCAARVNTGYESPGSQVHSIKPVNFNFEQSVSKYTDAGPLD